MAGISRRRFAQAGAGAALATMSRAPSANAAADAAFAADGWRRGDLAHLIPGANHERIIVKCSFHTPRRPPLLRIGGELAHARATDTESRYFAFDVPGLKPNHEYSLQLVDRDNHPLADAWPVRTFPAPEDRPKSVRLLAYTCAGGLPNYPGMAPAEQPFLALAARQRLLARALSFAPAAAIAIGDHLYWDQRTQLDAHREDTRRRSAELYGSFGMLDRSLPARGTANEAIIKAAVEPQFAHLYGVMLRSTPSYFVSDDHDYYENDEATDRFVTLPPHAYQLAFARFTRDLFMPEFLPDSHRPTLLSGANAGDRAPGISESFGTFRYGDLAEALIYDCARFLSLKGDVAGLVPPEAEAWLTARAADERVRHLFHVPSHPFGWTAGKWREWYPDVADVGEGDTAVAQMRADGRETFRLTTAKRKFMWQRGWFLQHQRLLASLAAQRRRAGVVLSGDLHATGHALIQSSGELSLDANPVHAILTGPLGTGRGWPSRARGTPPLTATGLGVEAIAPVQEKNGFALFDIERDAVTARLFAWRRGEPEAAIDQLEPYHVHTIKRRG